MTKSKLLSLALLSSLVFTSCEKDFIQEETSINLKATIADFDRMFTTKKEIGMRLFSEALVKSLNQSTQLRQIIKEEALYEFNNENDVLFVLIKDKPTEYGTVQELIASHISGGLSKLDEIINDNPTLTIFVPTLPKDSFSPATWDINGEIPSVGIRLNTVNNVPFIWNTGEEEVIPGEYIPDFPVLVVKDNERVLLKGDPSYQNLDTKIVYGGGNTSIRLIDNFFDVKTSPQSYLYSYTRHVDEKLSEAYDLYENIDGWHRDYIYYDINSSNPTGPMNYDFQETLGVFGMTGDASIAYNKIAEQDDDPHVNPRPEGGNWSHWTEGQFEFKASFLINSTSGSGLEVNKFFGIRPDDLFELTYQHHSKKFLFWTKNWYTLESIENKLCIINIPVITWNLQDKSTEITGTFSEIDIPTTTTYTTTHSSEYATNFELNTTLGTTEKVGMKFGASAKSVQTNSISRTLTQGNDDLGQAVVNFGDNVVIDKFETPIFFGLSRYKIRNYSTGTVRFSFEPRKVQ